MSSRYAGLACSDWPSCAQGVYFPTFEGIIGLQLVHRLNAYALVIVLALAAASVRKVPGLARPAAVVFGLLLLQIAIGVANVWLRIPVEVTALHSATAAALVLTMTFVVRGAWQRPLATVARRDAGSRHLDARLPGRLAGPAGLNTAATRRARGTFHVRCFEIFAGMSSEQAQQVLREIREKAPSGFQQALSLACGVQRMRPVYMRGLPFDKQAQAIRRALARVASNSVAEELLAIYFLECRRPLLVEWLDGIGLAHEDGILKDDNPPEPG